MPSLPAFNDGGTYNAADIAWLIVATALVFPRHLVWPFFYGGMVHRKNVLYDDKKRCRCRSCKCFMDYWLDSLCFGKSIGGFLLVINDTFVLKMLHPGAPWSLAPTIPLTLFALFQLMFAIITPGLVVGAVCWTDSFHLLCFIHCIIQPFGLCAYSALDMEPDGFGFKWGVLDFAGGTVVHISAGYAALAGALVLKRKKFILTIKKFARKYSVCAHWYRIAVVWLVWFQRWFCRCGKRPFGVSFATTNTAAAAAGLSWMFLMRWRVKAICIGFCIGAVVGLVAITPAAGFVAIPQSIFIGFFAAIVSNVAVYYKSKSKLDDALDVFPATVLVEWLVWFWLVFSPLNLLIVLEMMGFGWEMLISFLHS